MSLGLLGASENANRHTDRHTRLDNVPIQLDKVAFGAELGSQGPAPFLLDVIAQFLNRKSQFVVM